MHSISCEVINLQQTTVRGRFTAYNKTRDDQSQPGTARKCPKSLGLQAVITDFRVAFRLCFKVRKYEN